ncbi:uncharacterized protein BHQ10_009988 [Talaromyces amestolkiae]|uniref:EXS domain-containing protein n=1 Tax=Talaromyces amestolkiae TaxID=1196081 RepID=A0A364LDT7_TALAM|nr:uncharacterized protein BHQ10_009988 [Talaromyces amestolkiae]RAO73976.1 hypothetical protein BHQ10_009988 [Talaromyces amestolkiae]
MADSGGVQPTEELDRFGNFFPLPFRVAILLVAGKHEPQIRRLPWSLMKVLHGARLLGMGYKSSLLVLGENRCSSPNSISFTLFAASTNASPIYIPSGNTSLDSAWSLPAPVLDDNPWLDRKAEAQDGKFGDVLLADALTSYSKVLAEIYINYCMFFSSGKSSTGKPDRMCGGRIIVPLLIAIPYAIRFRQCLIEFFRVRRGGHRNDGWGGQHLANALKYSTAFPVIIFSNLERNYSQETTHGLSEVTVSRLWALFCFINSAYSFYWDVTKDWDLTLLSPTTRTWHREYPFGLRPRRIFPRDEMYYGVVAIDLVLRFTWLSRLSPHLDKVTNLESGIFLLMFLEIARRWIWIFFRVETEWVRSNRGPALDDVLLSDFSGKFDED